MGFDTDSVIIYDPLNGAATNGGGFAASRSGVRITSPIAYTDLVIDGLSKYKLSSVTRPFTADDRGNFICITGGTGFTPGWYEITSVSAGVASCDKAIGDLGSTGGTGNLGGYIDKFTDALMELSSSGITHQVWATAAMVLGESIDVSVVGSTTTPIYIEGRAADGSANPQGANRPTITCGANTFSLANHWWLKDLIFTSTEASGVRVKFTALVRNCKFSNLSETADRAALTVGGGVVRLIDCEFDSAAGYGVSDPNTTMVRMVATYIHDSKIGVLLYQNSVLVANIIEACSTTGLGVNGYSAFVMNNTIDTCVDGIDIVSTDSGLYLNNIISNCTSEGAVASAARNSNWWDYNNFYNCGTDRTKVAAGPNDNDVDPGYTNAAAGDFSTGANVADTGFGIRLGVG